MKFQQRLANQSAFVFRQLRAAWNRDCTGPRVDRLTAELAELAQAAGLKKLTLGLYRAEAIPTLGNLGSYLLSRGVGLSWRPHQGDSCLLFVYCLAPNKVASSEPVATVPPAGPANPFLDPSAGEPPAAVQVAA